MDNVKIKFYKLAAETSEQKGDNAVEKGLYKDALRYFKAAKENLDLLSASSTTALDSETELKLLKLTRKIKEAEKAISNPETVVVKGGKTNPTSVKKSSGEKERPGNKLTDNKAPSNINNPARKEVFEGADIPEEMSSFIRVYSPEEMDFGFEGVIGLDDVKEAVREYVINPRLYPEHYNYKFLEGNGIMLEGPPGTGKTTFATALAKELNQPFVTVRMSGIVNCYIGETAKNIDKIFDFLRDFAQKQGGEITVFFDEIDEIAKSRGAGDKTSEAAVPALLRNLGSIKENSGMLVIANTNYKDLLDKAIIDRFQRTFHIPLPDGKIREHLFRLKLKDVEDIYLSKLNFGKIIKASEGMNGRQITYVCDDFKHELARMKKDKLSKDVNVLLIDIISKRRNS